ncbi:MAG: DUF4405 domain-containing protein [Anaerolineales bacterium]|nr:DUF4405 domain-containing protein [Anaerolineales bacterium]MCB8990068.1 DUF4405 domain-containing protein [Ardenticatenaceae bacterium]MCB9005621.1 DUF4405 domain-containing protein [Ardenticatenaceae bacterium]
MSTRHSVSAKTRNNWLIDTAVFIGAALSMLSGIYFLIFSSGGYQGGSNSWYGVVVLFTRHVWGNIHTWGGLLMVTAVVIHLIIHWQWIKMMTRRMWQKACGQSCRIARGAWVNLVVDGLIALSFMVTAVSGLYFFFLPEGGFQGGKNLAWDPGFLFSRPIWTTLHTWGGIILILAAGAHIYIHWGWIVKVTGKVLPIRQLSHSHA